MTDNLERVSKEEFSAWKEDKVTKQVMNGISELLEAHKEALAAGQALGEDTAIKYANTVGFIAGLNALLAVDLDDVEVEYAH